MTAPRPCREGSPSSPALDTARPPIRWGLLGLCAMASSAIALAADLLAAFALNFCHAGPVGEMPLRWIAASCIIAFALGAVVAACAELRGDR